MNADDLILALMKATPEQLAEIGKLLVGPVMNSPLPMLPCNITAIGQRALTRRDVETSVHHTAEAH